MWIKFGFREQNTNAFKNIIRVATHPGKPGKSGKKNIGPGKSGNFLLGPGFFSFSSIFPMSGTSCRERENLPGNRCESESIKIKIQSFSVMTGMNYCVLQ